MSIALGETGEVTGQEVASELSSRGYSMVHPAVPEPWVRPVVDPVVRPHVAPFVRPHVAPFVLPAVHPFIPHFVRPEPVEPVREGARWGVYALIAAFVFLTASQDQGKRKRD